MGLSAQLSQTYESQTQAIARQLVQSEKGSWLDHLREQTRLEDKLMAWAMANPSLRVQLFRLIDTLPALPNKTEVARHLQEYLAIPSVELPVALKQILNFATPDSIPGQIAATTFTTAVSALAQKYIAGDTVAQVLKTIEKLRQQHMSFTIDRLGEAVITEQEAQSYLDGYLQLMTELRERPQVQISVKLTAFYSQFDPLNAVRSQQTVSDRLRVLLHRAQELGVAVHFDMEQYRYKTITLEILKSLLLEPDFRDRQDIGITLQAYLRESYADLESLIDWVKQRGTPITVRLVKGAYWDQETITALQHHWPQPVYANKGATDVNFERMTELLLQNHTLLHAAIASHNPRSQAKAIAIANALNIPNHCIEHQVLYGMADKLAKALVEQGRRVRVYCPYGPLIPGMAYLIRRLLENTANSSFLRQSQDAKAFESLLLPPMEESEHNLKATLPSISNAAESLNGSPPFANVADTDYAQPAARTHAAQALTHVRQQLGQSYRPLIQGEWVTTATTKPTLNPSNPQEVIGTVGQATIEQAEQAVASAKTASKHWRMTAVSQRAIILRRAADLMEQRRQELAYWMVVEVGKVLQEADVEVSEAIDFCRYYATEMERLDRGTHRDLAGETNHYHYQPRGIAVVISPWNFPLAIPVGMVVAALVTGNCTILKPAAPAAIIAAKFAEILVEAGTPAGVFQYLPGKGSELGSYLTQHPDVHLIVFTGSQAVGCQIYAEAAILRPRQTHLKRVIAEMGGKNAIIIDQSADLDQAVVGVVKSAFGYGGQKCSACSRVIVLAGIYDLFLERLLAATQSLHIGAADDLATQLGPVITAEAQQKILEYIAIGKAEAQIALEMKAPELGYFVRPTIFTEVSPQATIAQQEIFGPVLAVLRANTFDEAIAIANGTQYALTGGLYSRTPSHIEQAKTEFEVGNLYINRGITGAIVDRQPFGGFKLSGIGSKAGGKDYLLQFLEPRVITENIQRQGFAPIPGED